MSVPFPDAQLDKVEGQWKLQLQEVELRLKHLRIQQSQIDNGKQEQDTMRQRLLLEHQSRQQQQLQYEEQWKRRITTLQQQLEVQKRELSASQLQVRQKENTLQQQEILLVKRMEEASSQDKEMRKREQRLAEREKGMQSRFEQMTDDMEKQRLQIAEQWQQLQQKSREVAAQIATLNELMDRQQEPTANPTVPPSTSVRSSIDKGTKGTQPSAGDEVLGWQGTGQWAERRTSAAEGQPEGGAAWRRTPLWNRIPAKSGPERETAPNDVTVMIPHKASGNAPVPWNASVSLFH
jgi:hypothetical protein